MGKRDKEKLSLGQTIHRFINLNSLVIVSLILIVAFHQIFIVGSTVNSLEKQQEKMVKYLRENVNKVYFLSANGQVITAKKSSVSYTDDRFKQYLSNNVLDNLVGGSIWLSQDGKILYHKPEDIVLKHKKIKYMYENFIKPNGTVLAPYIKALYTKFSQNKLPEYIIVTDAKYSTYIVHRPSEINNFKYSINAILDVKINEKSWIPDLKKWDTRVINSIIRYKAIIDPVKYASSGNPWGVHITELKIPVITKPTANEVLGE